MPSLADPSSGVSGRETGADLAGGAPVPELDGEVDAAGRAKVERGVLQSSHVRR
jgi:hypothetical protein